MRVLLLFSLCLTLLGCGAIFPVAEPVAEDPEAGVSAEITLRPRARPAGLGSGDVQNAALPLDDSNGVAPAAPSAPSAPTAPGGSLGLTVASLGNPAEPGLWLKTPLVQAETQGRVRVVATGREARVTLIPLDGPDTAGSRISLGAMQALGVPLTDLTELAVFAG